MKETEELCLCFHVTRRKVEKFLRLENPQAASQLAECYGAGTGCGWCRPFLKKLFLAHRDGAAQDLSLPAAEQYASDRTTYVQQGGGTPPAE